MFNKVKQTKLSAQLRQAIQSSPISNYRLAQLAGVSESSISRFMHQKSGLSMKAIDRIWSVLELCITNSKESDDGV